MSGKSTIKALQLYMKLRLYANGKGGYVTDYSFSKSERYNILPKLIRLGIVKVRRGRYIKLVNHRKVCSNLHTHIYTEILENEIQDLRSFRSWIVSIAEKYSLQSNNKIQNGNFRRIDKRDGEWISERLNRENSSYHIEKFNDSTHVGSVSNEIIGSLLNVSSRCISKWRSEAIEMHSEDTSTYFKGNPSRSKQKAFDSLRSEFCVDGINSYTYITREMTPHEAVLVKSDELSGSNFFRHSNGRYYTKQLVISSNIEIFSIGHSHGRVMEENLHNVYTRGLKNKYKNKQEKMAVGIVLDT